MASITEIVSRDEVSEVLSQLGRHSHYLAEKPIGEWDGYDLSNFKSMKNKAGLYTKTKSLDKSLTNEQLQHQGCHVTSFLSFERAIRETLLPNQSMSEVKGYKVTSQGIEIIWK